MINIHSKDKHNWMVEDIKTVFACDKCKLDINDISTFENHMKECHSEEVRKEESPFQPYNVQPTDIMKEQTFSDVVKILPDQDFLTKNTADLKAMLEAIPESSLTFEEDTFEKDFKLVLNSVKEEGPCDNMITFQCDQCSFRGGSGRCLNAHITFVHSAKFYKCEYCPIKTRTEKALHYHIDMKHNSYWEVEEEVRGDLLKQIEKQPQILIKIEEEETFRFKCDYCEKSFVTNHGLVVHTSRIHKGEFRNKRKSNKG